MQLALQLACLQPAGQPEETLSNREAVLSSQPEEGPLPMEQVEPSKPHAVEPWKTLAVLPWKAPAAVPSPAPVVVAVALW